MHTSRKKICHSRPTSVKSVSHISDDEQDKLFFNSTCGPLLSYQCQWNWLLFHKCQNLKDFIFSLVLHLGAVPVTDSKELWAARIFLTRQGQQNQLVTSASLPHQVSPALPQHPKHTLPTHIPSIQRTAVPFLGEGTNSPHPIPQIWGFTTTCISCTMAAIRPFWGKFWNSPHISEHAISESVHISGTVLTISHHTRISFDTVSKSHICLSTLTPLHLSKKTIHSSTTSGRFCQIHNQ